MPLVQTTYDELPYTCNAMPYAQPDRLATVATLFGMTPPPVQTCRVLELGCCDGSNIIPTAIALPKAECWGVDLSAEHIANGQALIETLELPNITLKQLNILELDESFGKFDYIIAHGIFSWVPLEVQEKIFSICKHHLTPNGVVYISYNTKPGWNMRETLRDMMLYYTAPITDSAQQTEQSKMLLKFLNDTTADSQGSYSQFAHQEIHNFSQLPESFVCQEFLAEKNNPWYFHQFVEQAQAHGLGYVGDAFLHTMFTNQFSAQVAEALHVFKEDLIRQEQMMDVLSNRRFRHTLLCHQEISLNRSLSPDLLQQFHVASSLQPVANTTEQTVQQFANARGTLSSDQPVIQAAIRYLGKQWPQTVTFTELVKQAQQEIGNAPNTPDETPIADILLQSYSMGLIELYSSPPSFVTTISHQPQASHLARWQAQRSQKVTNQRCEWLFIENAVCWHLLPYLDGNRDQKALLDLLNEWVSQGKLKLNVKHQQTDESLSLTQEHQSDVLQKLLEDALHLVAKAALLVG